jgi:MFS family permease
MTAELFIIAAVVAVVAAVRSLWSPCGLSMLTTLNPVSERGRGHRYLPTAAWFLLGAVAGGALLGGATGVGALLVGLAHIPAWLALMIAVVLAAVCVAAERRWLGLRLPVHPRQVDESWTVTYRRFVYAAGYGIQIGSGFATYIMTTAVYLTAALAVLTASPVAALAVGVIFAATRGLAVLIGAAGTDPARLRTILRTLDDLAPASVAAALGVQVVAAVAAAGELVSGSAIPGAVALLAMTTLVGAIGVVGLASHRAGQAGHPARRHRPSALSTIPSTSSSASAAMTVLAGTAASTAMSTVVTQPREGNAS